MHALTAYGVEELDAGGRERTAGGNPVTFGLALVSAFGWGFRWGYDVAGPWLVRQF